MKNDKMSEPLAYTGSSEQERNSGISGGVESMPIPKVIMRSSEPIWTKNVSKQIDSEMSANTKVKEQPASSQLED